MAHQEALRPVVWRQTSLPAGVMEIGWAIAIAPHGAGEA